jgi:hypothetical protein
VIRRPAAEWSALSVWSRREGSWAIDANVSDHWWLTVGNLLECCYDSIAGCRRADPYFISPSTAFVLHSAPVYACQVA